MEFREYLESEINRINTENDDDQFLGICLGEKTFKYHNECKADFYEDFFIVKDDSVRLVIPYDKVIFIQPVHWDDIKSEFSDMMDGFLSKLLDDDEDD